MRGGGREAHGVSLITRQTEAIVLKQSVVFSRVSDGF